MQSNGLTMRLVEALYTEAMVLADEARSYFDDHGRAERDALPPLARVAFTCESLKVTTRLMHIIAWLLTRRAQAAGEIGRREAREPAHGLGRIEASHGDMAVLPETARALVEASDDLYRRVRHLDEALDENAVVSSPAHGLLERLARAF